MNGDTAVSGPCTSLEHRDHGPHPDCDQPWCTCPCHTLPAYVPDAEFQAAAQRIARRWATLLTRLEG